MSAYVGSSKNLKDLRGEESAGAKDTPVATESHAMSAIAMHAKDGRDIRTNPATDTKGGQSNGIQRAEANTPRVLVDWKD